MEKARLIAGLGPSRVTWEALCRLLDAWPDGRDLEAAIPRIDRALEAWPATFRIAPAAWRDGLAAGEANPRFRLVRRVDLSGSEFGDILAARLAGAPWMSSVKWLGLSANDIGDAGAVALAASPNLGGLEVLDLSHNVIGDVGAMAIAESGTLAALKRLDLCDNDIGESGVRALEASGIAGVDDALALEGNPGWRTEEAPPAGR